MQPYAANNARRLLAHISIICLLPGIHLYSWVNGRNVEWNKLPKVLIPQHRIRTRVLLVEPDGQKWTSDFPKKYGVYTGTKEADKKTSGKVISNFDYIAGWNYHLGDRFAIQSVLCSSIWHIESLNSIPNKVVKNWHFHFFGTVNPKLWKENHY